MHLSKVLLVIVSVFGVALAHSAPVPMLNLGDLCNRSELIVVGQVEAVQQVSESQMEVRGSSVRAGLMEARMRVDYALKGQINPGKLSFQFVLPQPESLGYRGVPSHYRVVFLKWGAAHWELANPFYPSFPAVAGAREERADVLGSVVDLLAAALVSRDVSEDDQVALIWVLGTVRTPRATQALLRVSKSTSRTVRIQSIAALLERNETSVMPTAVDLVSDPGDTPGYLIQNIASGIARGVRDPSMVPYLGKLLRLSDARVRRGAAAALQRSHTASAIPYLARALGDSDFEVRYCGVIGLAEITGQTSWRPLMDTFRDDENKYLNHWKTWASANVH